MSDIMRPISFKQLLNWVLEEYNQKGSIFEIPEEKFHRVPDNSSTRFFGERLDAPMGPAAGPNTQLAQNIVAAYLTGSRFFELKTVQIMDELEFPKPCIRAQDEGYNTEWSTELSIEGALEEYIKAWLLLNVLQLELFNQAERGFIFNMSVGYDLKGIQSPKVDSFIEGLKNASSTKVFQECQSALLERVDRFHKVTIEYLQGISSKICSSITLSTMHGCPPAEIEAISKYLISEKKLHTFVKMNPTLLGYPYVRNTFDQMGYGYVQLKEDSFTHDLQYSDGVAMLKRLQEYASEHHKEFGVKLSNTLPVKITQGELPGEEMYMSGRSLYPLTINLALKLASEFKGDLKISYSGGADTFNVAAIYETGIYPITVATTILKPGGYYRLKQIAETLLAAAKPEGSGIRLDELKNLAEKALKDPNHFKNKRSVENRKIQAPVPLIDCSIASCTVGCPIEQDIPEYIHLVGEGRYQEALEVITEKNPLPFITGTICNHQCMSKCTRLDYDESVLIRQMKLTAAEKGFKDFIDQFKTSSPILSVKVAVIGAGPSGLAAAYFLARAGLEVTVFDKRDRAGGTVEYVIPEFRISRQAIQNDIKIIEKMGVKFEFGVSPEFSVHELQAKGYKYIVLAIGAGKTPLLNLEGNQERIIGAIPFLEEFNKKHKNLNLGKSVAVIGAGNSAMDAARAALRVQGVEQVYIVYRRAKEIMPADREELELALKEGVILKELLTPISLESGVLQCQKMILGEPDAKGRKSPIAVKGEFEQIPVDTVLSAIGETVDYELLTRNGLLIQEDGQVQIDPGTLETNVPRVYLVGDVLVGPATVVMGIAQGKKAAKDILAKENLHEMEISPQVYRGKSDFERVLAKKGVLKGPNQDQAREEPDRCLECNLICNICVEVCPNRANIPVKINKDDVKTSMQILHIDGMCNECGNCATFCPYNGAPYKDKLTFYWSEEDFTSSHNQGFYLLTDGSEPSFRLRLGDIISDVKFTSDGKTSLNLNFEVSEMLWSVYKNYSYLIPNS